MSGSSHVAAALVVLLVAGGCRGTRHPEDEAPRVAEPAIDRQALADAIAGAQASWRPLSADVPDGLLVAIGVAHPLPSDRDALVQLSTGELDAIGNVQTKDLGETLALAMALARALVYAERAVAAGSRDPVALAVLERVYHAIDLPLLVNDRSLFPQMLHLFVRLMQQRGVDERTAAIDALARLVISTVKQARAAHRFAVAELLRSDADPTALADALERVAPKLHDDDDALAIRAMQTSLAMRGDAPAPRHHLALADVCHVGLDLACGSAALANARAAADPADADLAKRLARATTLADHAATVTKLQSARSYADRIRQADALLELGRYRDAEGAYARLHADFPHRAGPVTGLARHAVQSELDFSRAAEIVQRAGKVEHADLAYYEIAIGTQATAIAYDVLPRLLASDDFASAFASLVPTLQAIRRDVQAYEALGADKGVVLRLLFDVAMDELMPRALEGGLAAMLPVVRGLLPRTTAVLDRVPNSSHAYLLVAAAAQLSSDRTAAFAAIERLPKDDPEAKLLLRRAHARYDLLVTWGATDTLAALQADVADLNGHRDRPEVKMLAADTAALTARLGRDRNAWAAAEAAYRDAIGDPAASTDARALNNLAVAVAEQGRTDEAIDLWTRALATSEQETSVAKINVAAVARDLERLAELAQNADTTDARLHAHAWRIELVPRRDRAKAQRERTAALREAQPEHIRPQLPVGVPGVLLAGSFNVGLGYSSNEGLTLQLDSTSKPWLALTPRP